MESLFVIALVLFLAVIIYARILLWLSPHYYNKWLLSSEQHKSILRENISQLAHICSKLRHEIHPFQDAKSDKIRSHYVLSIKNWQKAQRATSQTIKQLNKITVPTSPSSNLPLLKKISFLSKALMILLSARINLWWIGFKVHAFIQRKISRTKQIVSGFEDIPNQLILKCHQIQTKRLPRLEEDIEAEKLK